LTNCRASDKFNITILTCGLTLVGYKSEV